LFTSIDETRRVVAATLAAVSEEQLVAEYPGLLFGAPVSLAHFLMHLATHLTYHLRQINYHRRLLDQLS
jgi:uncharacterized damage-inducible protein DinB